jgi:maltooligosyltrehalose trehalohydrolase
LGEEYTELLLSFSSDYSGGHLEKKSGWGETNLENGWKKQPLDPRNIDIFEIKNTMEQRSEEKASKVLAYYQKLISLRHSYCKGNFDKPLSTKFFLSRSKSLLIIQKRFFNVFVVTLANFSKIDQNYSFPCAGGTYLKILDSADINWSGPGSALPGKTKLGDTHAICPSSMAVYIKSKEKNYV